MVKFLILIGTLVFLGEFAAAWAAGVHKFGMLVAGLGGISGFAVAHLITKHDRGAPVNYALLKLFVALSIVFLGALTIDLIGLVDWFPEIKGFFR